MKKTRAVIYVVLVLALLFVLFAVIKIPCVIKLFTGVSCPGCGMSRAYRSLLHFDFSKAFYYHPLWLLVPVGALCYFLARKKSARLAGFVIIACVAAMICVYIVRWFTGPEAIVNFNFKDTLYNKLTN